MTSPSPVHAPSAIRSSLLSVVLLAALLVGGCSLLPGAEPAADARGASASAGADEHGAAVREQEAPPGRESPGPIYEPPPPLEATDQPDASGVYEPAVPAWAAWTMTVPEAFAPYVEGERPSPPQPLADRLPAQSALAEPNGQVDAHLAAALGQPSLEAAVQVAYASLEAMTSLVNDGASEPFATLASSQCEYCLFRLEAATAIHDGGGEQPQRWVMELDVEATAAELTAPTHVVVEITGLDHGLTYVIPGTDTPALVGIPGDLTARVELLFSEGRWWVIEVYAL